MARPQRTVRTQPSSKAPASAEQPGQQPRRPDHIWLDGPPARSDGYVLGSRLGLPATGRGSVASQGVKLGALFLDLVISGIVGFVITTPHTSQQTTVYNLVADGVFVVITSLALMLGGRTPGMRLLGLQVVRLDGRTMGWRAWPRQILCALLIPALIVDRDRRGLHDKPVGTVVVRTG